MSATEETIKKKTAPKSDDYRIPQSSAWAGYWKMFAGVGLAGLAASVYAYTVDAERFAFAYMFAFMFFLTLALGGIFFVLVERLTGAHWSVTIRRTAEFFMGGMPIFILLFLPIIALPGVMTHLFPWMEHGEHAKQGEHHSAVTSLISEAHAQSAGHGTGPAHGEGALPSGPPRGMPIGAGQRTINADHGPGPSSRPDPHHLEEERVLQAKAPYLNQTAFLIRAVVYFLIWTWLALRFFGLSTAQDASKDPKLTVAAQRFAPGATVLFGLSLTFAAFDWVMSLDPAWFSTIFGVTIFAGSVVAIFSTLIVVTMALREDGLLKNALKTEHYHDMGKLLFGFMIFWAYVSFSQFMLIWYAALPEETTFYHLRWDHGIWKDVSLAIVVLHFVVPFFVILSRNAKRRLPILRWGAMVLLAMHCVEMYWLVLPNYRGGAAHLWWGDMACFLGVGGIYLAVVFNRMTKHPLIPIGDPRLARSLHHEIENA